MQKSWRIADNMLTYRAGSKCVVTCRRQKIPSVVSRKRSQASKIVISLLAGKLEFCDALTLLSLLDARRRFLLVSDRSDTRIVSVAGLAIYAYYWPSQARTCRA